MRRIWIWIKKQFSWKATVESFWKSFAKTSTKMERAKARQKRGFQRMKMGGLIYGDDKDEPRQISPDSSVNEGRGNRATRRAEAKSKKN